MHKKRKWNSRYAIEAYRLSSRGCDAKKISIGLGITENTFAKWMRTRRLFKIAVNKGRSDRESDGLNSMQDYILERLPAKIRRLWDKINSWSSVAGGSERIDALLANKGKQVRQSLWLHAFMSCGFNASKACRFIGVSRPTVDQWKRDRRFRQLLDELATQRKDFLEKALYDLVVRGNPQAVIFANATVNRDRGYGKKAEMTALPCNNISFSIDDLQLPLKIKEEILEAYRRFEANSPRE